MASIRGAQSATGRYVQLTNAAGQDERLSLEARGIIYLVLSLPADQRFTRAWLVERVKGRNGRRAVDNALKELETFGYFRKSSTSAGYASWEWEQVITDDPALLAGDQLPIEVPAPVRVAAAPTSRKRSGDAPVTSDHIRSDVTTSENTTSAQVSSPDRMWSDVNGSNKELKTEDLKTKYALSPLGRRIAAKLAEQGQPQPEREIIEALAAKIKATAKTPTAYVAKVPAADLAAMADDLTAERDAARADAAADGSATAADPGECEHGTPGGRSLRAGRPKCPLCRAAQDAAAAPAPDGATAGAAAADGAPVGADHIAAAKQRLAALQGAGRALGGARTLAGAR